MQPAAEGSEQIRSRDTNVVQGHQELVGLCSSLFFSAKSYGDVKVDTRGKFTTSAVDVILRLTNRPHYVGQKALKHEEWKR